MIVSTYRQGDRYSAAVAGGAVIAYQVPRAVAAQKIAAVVGSLKLAEKLLDSPVSAAEWRATWASALTHDLAGIGDDVATIVDRERADTIEARLSVALEMLADVQSQNAELLSVAAAEEQRRQEAKVAQERILLQQAEQRAAVKQAAAAKSDRERWIDRIVIQEADGSVGVWREVTEFVGRFGPKREPEFRHSRIREQVFAKGEAPGDVLARVGIKPLRSKPYIPEAH